MVFWNNHFDCNTTRSRDNRNPAEIIGWKHEGREIELAPLT